jgi:hypothetical protein
MVIVYTLEMRIVFMVGAIWTELDSESLSCAIGIRVKQKTDIKFDLCNRYTNIPQGGEFSIATEVAN